MFGKLAFLLVFGVAFEKVYADEPEKIVGGTDASVGEFPYQVSLRHYDIHVCGGSIVSERHIITAAHCVGDVGEGFYNFYVVSGTVKLDDPDGQIHRVESIRIHPGYMGGREFSWANDAALITLKEPIQFNANQKPIPLATSDPPENAPLILSGWGQLGARLDGPNHLQKATVYYIGNEQCQKAFPRTSIFETHLCALHSTGIGACQGDSGGPLVYNGHLVGIVSWVLPCARGKPDVYTRVALYDNFFSEALQA